MYAPSSYTAGSSVSHFSNQLSPNEGMEPFYTGPDHTPGLAVYLLKDIGWSVVNGSGSANLHLALSDSGNHALDAHNTYTLTVSNNGGATASQTMLTYMIPHGHGYIASTPGQGSCQYSNRVVSCALGDITSLGSVNISIVAKMNAAGKHTHAAVVSSATAESSYSDNRVYQTTSVAGTNDLSLSMVPQTAAFTLGANYTYTATVSNQGPRPPPTSPCAMIYHLAWLLFPPRPAVAAAPAVLQCSVMLRSWPVIAVWPSALLLRPSRPAALVAAHTCRRTRQIQTRQITVPA